MVNGLIIVVMSGVVYYDRLGGCNPEQDCFLSRTTVIRSVFHPFINCAEYLIRVKVDCISSVDSI